MIRTSPIDVCITSRFPRAIDTARIALGDREIPFLEWPDFDEPGAGEYEGLPADDYLAWARQASFDAMPPGGESLTQVLNRYRDGYGRLIEQGATHTLLVGHGLCISVVLRALRRPEDGSRRFPAVPHAEPYHLSLADLEKAVGTISERLIPRSS
jgi:probable phosphoglycerate mutase